MKTYQYRLKEPVRTQNQPEGLEEERNELVIKKRKKLKSTEIYEDRKEITRIQRELKQTKDKEKENMKK